MAGETGDVGSIQGTGGSTGEGIGYLLQYSWAFLVAQLVKNRLQCGRSWVGKIPWRREKLPTPVFWPGEFHGLQGRKESDMTERLSLTPTLRQGLILALPLNFFEPQCPYVDMGITTPAYDCGME